MLFNYFGIICCHEHQKKANYKNYLLILKSIHTSSVKKKESLQDRVGKFTLFKLEVKFIFAFFAPFAVKQYKHHLIRLRLFYITAKSAKNPIIIIWLIYPLNVK